MKFRHRSSYYLRDKRICLRHMRKEGSIDALMSRTVQQVLSQPRSCSPAADGTSVTWHGTSNAPRRASKILWRRWSKAASSSDEKTETECTSNLTPNARF